MKKDYITEFFYSLAYNKKNEAEELFFKYTEVQNYPLALHFACYFGRVEFVDIISSHKPINGLDKCGANALHYAVNESSLGENNKDSIAIRKATLSPLRKIINKNNKK